MNTDTREEEWRKIDEMYSELEILCHNEGYDKIPLIAIFATLNPGKNLVSVMTVKEECSEAFYLLGMMVYIDKGQIRSKAFDDAYYQYRAYLATHSNYIRLREDEEQYSEQVRKIKAKIDELEQYTNEVGWQLPFFVAVEVFDEASLTNSILFVTYYYLFTGYPAFNIVTFACGRSLHDTYTSICNDNANNLDAIEEERVYLERQQ